MTNRFIEKLKTIGFQASKIGKKATSSDIRALVDNDQSDIGKMARDKVMMRHIFRGNQSDKKLNRDATAIIEDRMRKEKQDGRESRLRSISEKKAKFKARWGYVP